MQKGVKFRIYPNREQQTIINLRSRRKKLTPHNWGVIFSEKG